MRQAPQDVRTVFATFVCAQRRRLFEVERNADLLLSVLESNRSKRRFHLHAFVIMPDHVHVLLTPAPEVSLEKAIQYVKGGYSFLLKSKSAVWEPGFNESRVRDRNAFLACKDYIERNPVRKKLCALPEEFAFSSAHPASAVDVMPQWFSKANQG